MQSHGRPRVYVVWGEGGMELVWHLVWHMEHNVFLWDIGIWVHDDREVGRLIISLSSFQMFFKTTTIWLNGDDIRIIELGVCYSSVAVPYILLGFKNPWHGCDCSEFWTSNLLWSQYIYPMYHHPTQYTGLSQLLLPTLVCMLASCQLWHQTMLQHLSGRETTSHIYIMFPYARQHIPLTPTSQIWSSICMDSGVH